MIYRGSQTAGTSQDNEAVRYLKYVIVTPGITHPEFMFRLSEIPCALAKLHFADSGGSGAWEFRV